MAASAAALVVLVPPLASCSPGAGRDGARPPEGEQGAAKKADAGTRPSRPNLLLLTVDTLRPDHLGCYGYPKRTSPNLDSLASRSVLYEDAVSTSAWTSPGLISLLTGLHPSSHGVVNRESSLPPGVPSLPALLAQAGWHVPNLTYLTSIPNYANLGFGPPEKKYFTGEKGDELLRWLDEAAGASEPFFTWYHYRFVHLPYDPPAEIVSRFLPPGGAIPPPEERSSGLAAVGRETIIPRAGGRTRFDPEKDPPLVRALYDGEVFVMDEFLGRVLGLLRKKGLDDRTIFVVTADHGEELLEHGWVGHASTSLDASLYEEVVRIPLVIRFPKGEHAGKRVAPTVSAVDCLPTILDALGLPIPAGVEGRSTMPLARGAGVAWREEPAILETNLGGYQTPADRLGVSIKAIRRGGWKLIQKKDGPVETHELYDLDADPAEKKNLAGTGLAEEASLGVALGNWILHHSGPGFFLGDRRTPNPGEQAVPGAVPCPTISRPSDGASLHFEGDGGLVRAQWTGTGDLTYLVEYDVGEGEFHVNGAFPLKGNVHEFGPYPKEVWRSLRSWNPWKVKVVLPGRRECESEWVTFYF